MVKLTGLGEYTAMVTAGTVNLDVYDPYQIIHFMILLYPVLEIISLWMIIVCFPL